MINKSFDIKRAEQYKKHNNYVCQLIDHVNNFEERKVEKLISQISAYQLYQLSLPREICSRINSVYQYLSDHFSMNLEGANQFRPNAKNYFCLLEIPLVLNQYDLFDQCIKKLENNGNSVIIHKEKEIPKKALMFSLLHNNNSLFERLFNAYETQKIRPPFFTNKITGTEFNKELCDHFINMALDIYSVYYNDPCYNSPIKKQSFKQCFDFLTQNVINNNYHQFYDKRFIHCSKHISETSLVYMLDFYKNHSSRHYTKLLFDLSKKPRQRGTRNDLNGDNIKYAQYLIEQISDPKPVIVVLWEKSQNKDLADLKTIIQNDVEINKQYNHYIQFKSNCIKTFDKDKMTDLNWDTSLLDQDFLFFHVNNIRNKMEKKQMGQMDKSKYDYAKNVLDFCQEILNRDLDLFTNIVDNTSLFKSCNNMDNDFVAKLSHDIKNMENEYMKKNIVSNKKANQNCFKLFYCISLKKLTIFIDK